MHPLAISARTALLLVCVALAFAGRPAHASEPAAPARTTSTYGSALPRFALFGWVGPPRESTTVERYAELAGTGFNVTVLAWGDSGTYEDNRVRLDITRPFGLKNLMLDNDLDSVSTSKPESYAFADTIVARYKDDPAFLGYYLGDEPPASYFPRLGEWFEILRPRDPVHPCWNSLAPRGAFTSPAAFQLYLQHYVDLTQPAVLCNNQYDFTIFGDSGYLTENIATMGLVARAGGIPFWGVVQLVEHFIFRHVTEGMLRWQAAQWLAWGARGIGYFTYWTPSPVPGYDWEPAMIDWKTGERTEYYDIVTALNARLAPVGNTLAGMTWRKTQHSGSVPPGGVPFASDTVLSDVEGRATLGQFVDSTGAMCVFVANADSSAPRTVTLQLSGGRRPSRLRDDGSAWDSLAVDAYGRVALALEAGDFALLRLSARANPVSVDPPPARPSALRLSVTPNPAFGRARFSLAGGAGAATLEVLDLSGRIVWSREVPAQEREVFWSGERHDGGRAVGGIYFARVRDAHGADVQRVTWLGAR